MAPKREKKQLILKVFLIRRSVQFRGGKARMAKSRKKTAVKCKCPSWLQQCKAYTLKKGVGLFLFFSLKNRKGNE